MKLRPIAPYAGIVLAALIIDQIVKRLVEASLPLHEPVDILPFLALYHSRNTGVAFSMLSGVEGPWLSLLVLVILVVVVVLAFKTESAQLYSRLGFALIVGGALGNLVDRGTLGYVVDYIYFHTPVWSFAIFNLADVFITIGAGLVILDEVLAWRRAPARD
ncbi:signal peptidase II [Nitratireductor thuwali]|uniref:Lipoprotein signal peptidase n=1 Tax=Nitratireductor thuwali TaxID=2267699 RepID=A0ABY5MIU4_9HYPH|nr:Lipoprotein signal peptidase [Nitratireductor thuwali]